jgi:hypothetical protein
VAPVGRPGRELPGLILALDKRHGPSHPITRLMLGMAGWDPGRPRRLRVDGPAGSRVVRLGWFATMPAGLLTATREGGQLHDYEAAPGRSRPAAPSRPSRPPLPAGPR